MCGIEEVKKFQAVLPEYQIHVVSKDHFNAIIYAGPEKDKNIYVYYHDNHFDVITSMAAFMNRSCFAQNVKKDTTTNTSINATTRVKCVESYTKRATKPGYTAPYATVTLKVGSALKCTRFKVKKAILHVEHTTDVNVDRP